MSERTKCAGLFAPCDNPPDPAFTVEDPDGELPPVMLCPTCGRTSEEFFRKVFSDPRLTKELEIAVTAAEAVNAPGGIS